MRFHLRTTKVRETVTSTGRATTGGEWEAHNWTTTTRRHSFSTCSDQMMEMASDGNIPSLPLRYSSFSRLLAFLMRLCSEFETNAAAGSGCKRKDKSKRERQAIWRERKKWLVLTRLLIWHWIIYYISLASMCVLSMEQRRWRRRAEKTMKRQGQWRRSANLVRWTSDNDSLSLLQWRVAHLKFSSLSLFFFGLDRASSNIRTGTVNERKRERIWIKQQLWRSSE